MAQELELEWWRPQPAVTPMTADEAAPSDSRQASLPFFALMAFTVVMLFAPQNYFPALAPLRPVLLIMVIGISAYVADRWARGVPIIDWNRENSLVAGLLGLAALTVPFSIWPGGSAAVMADYIKIVIVFLLLSHVVTTIDRLRRAAWLLTFMAIGLGLSAFYNFVTGAFVVDQGGDRLMGNEGALTKNPNDLALMVNLLLPLTVGLFLSSPHVWQRIVLLMAIGIETVTVVLTYSRGGAVTLAAIVAVYLWKLRRAPQRPWMYGALFVVFLLLPLLPSSYLERLSTITNVQADRSGSAQERLSDMIIATKTILANPVIGAGMGMNVLAMREERGGWLGVHNVYLEHAVDLGLTGLALFLALLISCIRAVADIQRRNVPPELFFLAQGIQVSLIAYTVAAMFHPVSYHMYFYYIGGLAIAARAVADIQRSRTEVPA